MKKVLIAIFLSLSIFSLMGNTYEKQMQQAEQLFKSKKFKDAAVAFDDASLETEDAQKRINARFRSWECLQKMRSRDAVSTAESLLYDEPELSFERKIKLMSYIARQGKKENREKVLSFGLNLKGLSERERSQILLVALKNQGTWQSEAWVKEILAMKDPDPAAKANALGDLANVYLWSKRDPVNALKYVNEALAIKELQGQERQFYLLVQARSYIGVKRVDMAERSYRAAIKIGKQHNFQEAAYNELIRVYVMTKQGMKIEPLVKQAITDKRLVKRQRQVFSNLLAQIEKAKQQQNGR